MRVTAFLTLLLLGALGASPASAAEVLTPKGDNVQSLVRSVEQGGNYVNLPPGGRLEFAVKGPQTFEVYVRQRLPSATSPIAEARVSVQVDGQTLTTARVNEPLESGATVTDIPVAFVTRAAQAPVDVPAGDHTVTVIADRSESPLLVQVVVSSAWGSSPAPAAVSTAAPAVVEEDNFDLTELLKEEDPSPIWTATESTSGLGPSPATSAKPVTPEPSGRTDRLDSRALSELSGGVRLGLGAANAGNKASTYIGVELRLPVSDHIALTGGLGRYNIHLEQELAIQPDIGGIDAQTVDLVDWRTRVRPLELGAQLRGPLTGDLEIYAGAAATTMFSTRIDEEGKTRGLSLGRAWNVGLNVPVANNFTLSPSFSVNAGRRKFDNLSADGDIAREQLRTGRINLALFTTF